MGKHNFTDTSSSHLNFVRMTNLTKQRFLIPQRQARYYNRFYSTTLTDRRGPDRRRGFAGVIVISPNKLATRSPEELVGPQRFMRLENRGKEMTVKNEARKDGRGGGEKRAERGWHSCRRRAISGSGALIHFILCALKRRSIKAGKSHRDSTPARKSGGGRDDRVVWALESWNRFCLFTPNWRTIATATSTIVDRFHGVAPGNSRLNQSIDTRCDHENFIQ